MPPYQIFPWFAGINLAFIALFAIITGLVSYLAYKVYKLTENKNLKLFSLAFLSIAVGYILSLLFSLNAFFMLKRPFMRRVLFGTATTKFNIIFTLLGLCLLVYMTFKQDNKTLLALLLSILAVVIFTTLQPLILFHSLAAVVLTFIVIYYYNHFGKKRNKKIALVLIAFILLLLSQILLIFSGRVSLTFLLGRTVELAGYSCILANLILVLRK